MALVDDIRELTDEVKALNRVTETYKLELQRHDQQINGDQGIYVAIDKLAQKVEGLTHAAYWLAGLIVASSVGFAFSVLLLIR